MEKHPSRSDKPTAPESDQKHPQDPPSFHQTGLELDEWEKEEKKERDRLQGQERAGEADTIGNP